MAIIRQIKSDNWGNYWKSPQEQSCTHRL